MKGVKRKRRGKGIVGVKGGIKKQGGTRMGHKREGGVEKGGEQGVLTGNRRSEGRETLRSAVPWSAQDRRQLLRP